jgi:ssDNA-binding Zn-finger/Zn-ribbon topoisomerase 1
MNAQCQEYISYSDGLMRWFCSKKKQTVPVNCEECYKQTEPLRWLKYYTGDLQYLKCPVCNWDDSTTNHEDVFNYCPICGVKLDPPEEEE